LGFYWGQTPSQAARVAKRAPSFRCQEFTLQSSTLQPEVPFVEDVTVIATEGSYTETVSPPVLPAGPRTAALAVERPGTYRIEVQAPGYVTWVMTSVRVTKDDCHVGTVELTAQLEKAGAG